MLCGDACAQKFEGGDYDWIRALVMSTYSMAFFMPLNVYWVANVASRVASSPASMAVRRSQIPDTAAQKAYTYY